MKKIVLSFAALAILLTSSLAVAAPALPPPPAHQPIVQKAYYHGWHHGWRRWYGPPRLYYGGPVFAVYGGGYCYRWRDICAGRWGWGGPGFGRCLWRHGC
ncbi:hypothetical protein [Hyphomicrobium sp. 802]|uniref:hypothetical protein n=1 Tax=Hyphomicrobium sp. 802 TaxID=1112272 RepID=UPI00045E6035|nr:hypothetical protein [Hyphomicrobium sp. 802]